VRSHPLSLIPVVRKLLLQLDTSHRPSVFDRIVAFDGGADEVMSYGGVTDDAVRELVHGAIFTRGPKDLHHTAIFIGGTDMAAGERILAAVLKSFFGPMRVSVMLDSNGSNTTAVAAVTKLQQACPGGSAAGRRAIVTAGTGPVGLRAAGLLARAGAHVVITSRRTADQNTIDGLQRRFGGSVRAATLADPSQAAAVLEGAELVLNAGPAGVRLIPRDAWAGRTGMRAAADVNAVPPSGVEGIEATDSGVERDGVTVFGALGVGSLKMKIHKACIARLFEQNDLVLDAETIVEVARTLAPPRP
jgi:methylenetetrahydrofolate/methylenetetrahydromethanopterin dehydrogenase (NADP+)